VGKAIYPTKLADLYKLSSFAVRKKLRKGGRSPRFPFIPLTTLGDPESSCAGANDCESDSQVTLCGRIRPPSTRQIDLMYVLALLPVLISAPGEAPEAVRTGGARATVRLSDPGSEGVGTGVVVGVRDGEVYVLTAAHVVPRGAKPRVEPFGGPGRKAELATDGGEVVFRVAEADLAMLRLPAGGRDWAVARLAPKFDGKDGWVIGCDDGREPRVTAVAVGAKKLVRRAEGTSAFFWQADGESVPGRSGGPLFDPGGRLIGICSGTQGGKTYFAHPDEIWAALKAHRLSWLLEQKGDR
jgi:S1-C subfamily serine protease